MADYVIPNAPDAADINLAEPDAGDFRALGHVATGVISGGTVSALGTPAMSVQISPTEAVVNDTPISYAGGQAAIANSGGSPRFDLVGLDAAGAVVVVTGVPNANPTFPVFSPSTLCLLAAVYVGSGVSTITSPFIVSKVSTLPKRLQRKYAAGTDVVVQSQVGSDVFVVNADGSITWPGNNKLRRIATTAMEFATTLTLKAADLTQGVVLKLRAHSSMNAADQQLLQVQSSTGVTKAYINAQGQIHADNFKWGTTDPEGSLVGAKGDIYINRAAPGRDLLWIKRDGSGNTGWFSLRDYIDGENSLPSGTIIPWLGDILDSTPTGFIRAIGQELSTTDPTYAGLYALIGTRYGSGAGTFVVPDLRGRMLVGWASSDPILPNIGEFGGSTSVALSRRELPEHRHGINDPGHDHPQPGPYWYYRPSSEHNDQHPSGSSSLALPHLYSEPTNYNHNAKTGISLDATGGGEPFSVLNPCTAIMWLIAL